MLFSESIITILFYLLFFNLAAFTHFVKIMNMSVNFAVLLRIHGFVNTSIIIMFTKKEGAKSVFLYLPANISLRYNWFGSEWLNMR